MLVAHYYKMLDPPGGGGGGYSEYVNVYMTRSKAKIAEEIEQPRMDRMTHH